MFEHCDWIGVQRASPLGSTSFWVLLLVSTNSARPPSGEVSVANSYSLQVAAVGQGTTCAKADLVAARGSASSRLPPPALPVPSPARTLEPQRLVEA